jgi:hypothetical protein
MNPERVPQISINHSATLSGLSFGRHVVSQGSGCAATLGCDMEPLRGSSLAGERRSVSAKCWAFHLGLMALRSPRSPHIGLTAQRSPVDLPSSEKDRSLAPAGALFGRRTHGGRQIFTSLFTKSGVHHVHRQPCP